MGCIVINTFKINELVPVIRKFLVPICKFSRLKPAGLLNFKDY